MSGAGGILIGPTGARRIGPGGGVMLSNGAGNVCCCGPVVTCDDIAWTISAVLA